MNQVPIGTIANLPHVIDAVGFDGWGFMQRFGLSPQSFVRPLQPIPISLCGEMLHAAVAYTAHDELPLLVGSRARMENLGPLRLLMANARRVRDAINSMIRFRRVWYPGYRIALTEERGIAGLIIDFSGHFDGKQEICTAYLAAAERHLRLIVGSRWRSREVQLSRPAPADVKPYRKQFGVCPSFGHGRDALFFDARLLDIKRPAVQDAELDSFLVNQMSAMAAALGSTFAEQVSELVETLLMSGGCSVERVADILGIHRLTLYRRLQDDGTTFEVLLASRRRTIAEGMLRRDAIPITEISEALGYSTAANFARAFHRWADCSPTQWRLRSQAQNQTAE
jgi:AraC-like DNA-binding protein